MENQDLLFSLSNKYNSESLDDLLNRLPAALQDHSRRVAICSAFIAGFINDTRFLNAVPAGMSLPVIAHLGGTCHDIGKLFLADVDPDEKLYLSHPILGADLLETNRTAFFDDDFTANAVVDIVRHHHEHPDGSGFPNGLTSVDIPPAAWFCTVANDLDHFMGTAHAADKCDMVILENFKTAVNKTYFEYAVYCLEKAWPYILDKYKVWNHDK